MLAKVSGLKKSWFFLVAIGGVAKNLLSLEIFVTLAHELLQNSTYIGLALSMWLKFLDKNFSTLCVLWASVVQ